MAKKTVELSIYMRPPAPKEIKVFRISKEKLILLQREADFIKAMSRKVTTTQAKFMNNNNKWTVKEMRTYIRRWENSKYSDIREYADILSKRIKDSQSIGKKKGDVAKSSCHIFIACIDQEKCCDYQKGETMRCKYASKRDDGCGNIALIAEELISSLKGYTGCKTKIIRDKKA